MAYQKPQASTNIERSDSLAMESASIEDAEVVITLHEVMRDLMLKMNWEWPNTDIPAAFKILEASLRSALLTAGAQITEQGLDGKIELNDYEDSVAALPRYRERRQENDREMDIIRKCSMNVGENLTLSKVNETLTLVLVECTCEYTRLKQCTRGEAWGFVKGKAKTEVKNIVCREVPTNFDEEDGGPKMKEA